MKNKVQQTDDNLPGYPHYPASEDITFNENKIDADTEFLSAKGGEIKPVDMEGYKQPAERSNEPGENDITDEDLKVIGTVDQDMDGGEDETLIPLVQMNEKLMGADLDVPGNDFNDSEMDPEDEENNLYSRGQD